MLRQTCQRVGLLAKSRLTTNDSSALFSVPVRYRKPFRYPKVTYLPFDWDYPPKADHIADSGDRTRDFGFTDEMMSRPKTPFSRLPEIETAPEEIKKLFSIEFAPYFEQRQSVMDEFVNRVRRHPYDISSYEYRIAKATMYIRAFKHTMDGERKSKFWKVRLLHTIGHRNKLLRLLGRYDRERYDYVKEVLEIDHTFAPLERTKKMETRKGVLRQMTAEYADKIKQEKLLAYHEELKARQKEFETEKRETEEWIAKEIEDLKLTDAEIESLEYKAKIFA